MAEESPDRVILFIIDGLAVGANDRIDMPHYNGLKSEGVYYRTMYLPPAGHPEKNEESLELLAAQPDADVGHAVYRERGHP